MEYKIVNCPHCGKIIPQHVFNGKLILTAVSCPQCGSKRSYKDGKRKTCKGEIQRYLCRECGYRFSKV